MSMLPLRRVLLTASAVLLSAALPFPTLASGAPVFHKITAPVSGRLLDALPQTGSTVKKGQLLARMSSLEDILKEQTLLSELEDLKETEDAVLETLSDLQKKAKKGRASSQDVFKAQDAVNRARMAVIELKGELSASKVDRRIGIFATDTGIVSSSPYARLGTTVLKSGDVVLEIKSPFVHVNPAFLKK